MKAPAHAHERALVIIERLARIEEDTRQMGSVFVCAIILILLLLLLLPLMLNKLTSVTKAHWLISPMDAWRSRSSQMIDRFGLTGFLATSGNVADG